MRSPVASALLVALGLSAPGAACAGMPAPLPTDPDLVYRLGDSTRMRLQALSFFVAAIGLCALAVWGLWNYLRRDFPRLPRLSFARALAGVVLWGLLFTVVLTMIAGARELMTPGAWEKQGFTYKLAPSAPPETSPAELRRQHLERLRAVLFQFAATHRGRFPTDAEALAMPEDLWAVPGGGGLRYLYVAGRAADGPPDLLVFEPELDPDDRLVLQSDGAIVHMRSAEIAARRGGGRGP